MFNDRNVRKYIKGENACRFCQRWQHEKCRPKLDGTLCSCSCIQAQMVRDEVERKLKTVVKVGQQIPNLQDMISIMYPRWSQKL